MSEYTPLLPDFPVRFGRPRKNISLKIKEDLKSQENTLSNLKQFLSPWLSFSRLAKSSNGQNSRERVYDMTTTFLAYLLQLLNNESCLSAVKRIQSWRKYNNLSIPSSFTGSYCKARLRFPMKILQALFNDTVTALSKNISLWKGFRVMLVDGTGLSMPDTKENQKKWPQNKAARKGCGFPEIRLVGLFCLRTGALLKYLTGSQHNSEMSMWIRMIKEFSPGDLVVADRAYGNFGSLALLMQRNVQAVFCLDRCRKVDWSNGNDQIVTWTKAYSKCIDDKQWEALPKTIAVRVLKTEFIKKGFRPKELILVTTLTDPSITKEQLVALYLERWDVELYFRDIKVSLGMDILSSKSPQQVEKEIQLYSILYNVIRGMINKSKPYVKNPDRKISFKSTVDHCRNWLCAVIYNRVKSCQQFALHFYKKIADCIIPFRPGRSEPRCQKRRVQKFPFMIKPREKMRVKGDTFCIHRNGYITP